MTANELLVELSGDVVYGERALVRADLGVEDDVQQEVAEFLDEGGALA